jgi:hypothetical protein
LAIYNGRASINGYVLPPGVTDPDALAEAVDRRLAEVDPEHRDLYVTVANLWLECDKLCSAEAEQKMYFDSNALRWLRDEAMAGPARMAGLCVGGGAAWGAGTGGSVCLVSDRTGLALTISWAPVTQGTKGFFAGVGPTYSNGSIEDQKGAFLTIDVGAGSVIAIDQTIAFANGTYTGTTMIGVGSGLGGSVGPSNTRIFWLHRN